MIIALLLLTAALSSGYLSPQGIVGVDDRKALLVATYTDCLQGTPESMGSFAVVLLTEDAGATWHEISEKIGGGRVFLALDSPSEEWPVLVGELDAEGPPRDPFILTRRDGAWSRHQILSGPSVVDSVTWSDETLAAELRIVKLGDETHGQRARRYSTDGGMTWAARRPQRNSRERMRVARSIAVRDGKWRIAELDGSRSEILHERDASWRRVASFAPSEDCLPPTGSIYRSVTTELGRTLEVSIRPFGDGTGPFLYREAHAPAHGTLGELGPSTTYTPVSGFEGEDFFSVYVRDSTAGQAWVVFVKVNVTRDQRNTRAH